MDDSSHRQHPHDHPGCSGSGSGHSPSGLVLTLPIFALAMAGHGPGLDLHALLPARVSIWVQLLLSTPVVLWAGWPFFSRGWASVTNRSLNMFTLIALGTGAAYLYSLVA